MEELTRTKAELEDQLANAQTETEGLRADLERVENELAIAKQEKADAVSAATTAAEEKQQAIEARDTAIREKEDAEARATAAEAELERLKALINASNIKNATIEGVSDETYTGAPIVPSITVSLDNKTLTEGTDYTVYYVNNIDVGTATVIVTGEGNYDGVCKKTFEINKASNPLTVKTKTVTIKYSKLKKKTQTVAVTKAFAISKAQGKVTYKKTSGNSKITVSSAGKITVKKKLKKGTYKVKVNVTAAGNKNYEEGSKLVTVSIKVK